MLRNILLAIIPIFVAVDAFGLLPIYMSFAEHLSPHGKRQLIIQSILTALVLAVAFIFLGLKIFALLGITVGDFMIAGGAILFCLAITDLLSSTKQTSIPGEDLGVVPLGTPLIAGPAVLTSSVVIISQYGLAATVISVVVNIVFAGVLFAMSGFVIRVIGRSGAKALSKIVSLFLAAIGVMMIRKGIFAIAAGT
ncbi:MAG: MarC family protein [Phycisphaerae bacterium]|nr:MarC family protein [Phycisphaerae bacterium]